MISIHWLIQKIKLHGVKFILDILISRLLHVEAIDAHSPINQGENIFIVYLALPLKDNNAS